LRVKKKAILKCPLAEKARRQQGKQVFRGRIYAEAVKIPDLAKFFLDVKPGGRPKKRKQMALQGNA
jgi:hypothetical protein